MKKNLIARGGRVGKLFVSAALVVGLMPSMAFAADLTGGSIATQADESITVPDPGTGTIIGAAFAAAEPAPDLLGLNNPEERNTGNSTSNEESMKLVIFGDADINENPDPYFYNSLMYLREGKTKEAADTYTPRIMTDTRVGGGPMAARNVYGAKDVGDSDAIWNLLPDIIIGTGDAKPPANETIMYQDEKYTKGAETANDKEQGSYKPLSVTYNNSDLNTMIDTMYKIAKAANDVKTGDSNRTWRYADSPMQIAQKYERFITGTKGYVLKLISEGKAPLRTVCQVRAYDPDAKTFTIMADDEPIGTATHSRLLEAVGGVTTNLYNTKGATVTVDDLKALVADGGMIMTQDEENSDVVKALGSYNLLDNTYYCTNMNAGSIFGVTVNSVENGQNPGRILPCLYPELPTQAEYMAYYYRTFYHVKSGKVGEMLDKYMDGVRNWKATDAGARLLWSAGDVPTSDYVSKVDEVTQAGIDYLLVQGVDVPVLTPTSNQSKSSTADKQIDNATVEGVGDQVSSSVSAEPTVKLGDTTLVKDTDYTVAYKDASGADVADITKAAAGTYTVVITAKEGNTSGYTGTTTRTFRIAKEDLSALKFDAIADQPYTGNSITPASTLGITTGSGRQVKTTTYAEGTDYKVVSYINNVNLSTDSSKASVTIEGIGDYIGSQTIEFKIVDKLSLSDGYLNLKTTSYAWSGQEIKPAVTVQRTGGDGKMATLEEGTDYALVYAFNKNVGTGYVFAIGLGSYKGVLANTFAITKGTQAISVAKDSYSVKATDAAFSLGASTSGDGALSYATSNAKVATVSGGKVTPVGAGTATITVKAAASDNCAAAADKTVKITVARASQAISGAATVSKSFKANAKTKKLAKAQSFTLANKGKTATTFAAKSGKVSITKAGKVTVKKGLKKGKYTLKTTATAAQTDKYTKATKAITVKVTVK